MKSAIFFTSLFLTIFPLHSLIQEKEGMTPRKVLMLTIPKGGSHLLAKAAELITGKPVKMLLYTDMFKIPRGKYQFDPEDGIIHWQHLFSEFDTIKNQDSSQFIKVVHIRDLRDILISQMDWIRDLGIWARWVPRGVIDQFKYLEHDEQVSFVIKFPDEYDSVRVFAKRALEWLRDPSVFLCRFEDLIGPAGGGDRQRQEDLIRALADHLGYFIDQEGIEYVADHLFGGTLTFRKGQIGRWKEHFTEEHIQLFKEVMGQELIDLGYEKDLDW